MKTISFRGHFVAAYDTLGELQWVGRLPRKWRPQLKGKVEDNTLRLKEVIESRWFDRLPDEKEIKTPSGMSTYKWKKSETLATAKRLIQELQ